MVTESYADNIEFAVKTIKGERLGEFFIPIAAMNNNSNSNSFQHWCKLQQPAGTIASAFQVFVLFCFVFLFVCLKLSCIFLILFSFLHTYEK